MGSKGRGEFVGKRPALKGVMGSSREIQGKAGGGGELPGGPGARIAICKAGRTSGKSRKNGSRPASLCGICNN